MISSVALTCTSIVGATKTEPPVCLKGALRGLPIQKSVNIASTYEYL